jgi:hypothetical protein
MRTRWLVVAALMVGVCPTTAAADIVHSMYGDRLELGPATIDVTLGRDQARYVVRYEVRNTSAIDPDEAEIEVGVPTGASIIAMRYQPHSGARWLDARLLESNDASARWNSYADAPYAGKRGPALLEMQDDAIVLRLLFVPARDRVMVEYTMVAPVCHARSRWIAPAPPIEAVQDARYVVHGPRGAGWRVSGDIIDTDACERTDPVEAWDSGFFLAADAPETAGTRGVDGRLVMVPAGDDRVVEITIDTGAELAQAPRNASVVFVVDASHSMGVRGVVAQLAIIDAYLARAPGARVEIVVYRRFATTVFGGWRRGADVRRAIATGFGDGAFDLGNGSNLDDGLMRAAALLAGAPGPRRLVAFTDDDVREALDEDVARAALVRLPADAIVHFVGTAGAQPASSESSIERQDDHWLAPVAARWGGISAWAHVGDARETAHARADVFEELVRPHRIENLRIVEGHGADEELEDIVEGQRVRSMYVAIDDAFTVTGMIWGREWQPTLVTSELAQRQVAALAMGDVDVFGALDDEASIRALARFGHVVSDWTSLWADDPRWVPAGLPPEIALERRATPDFIGLTSGSSFASHRCCGPDGVGFVNGGGGGGPDMRGLLEKPVAVCAARRGIDTWSVALVVETTGREIVDVRLRGGADDPAFATCVIENAWALRLGDEFAKWTASFDVNVTGSSVRR